MKAVHIKAGTQAPTALTYTDAWGVKEYIFAREGLCSRAGCQCISGSIVCNNFEYVYFSRVIYNWYAGDCSSTCTCELEPSPASQSVSLSRGGKNVSVSLIESPGSGIVNTANR